jgi:hypothetical protein
MSSWVRVFVGNPVDLTPDSLRGGIAHRLELLTYLFCPEDEEDPEDVLSRLTIQSVSTKSGDLAYALRYRAGSGHFIRLDRTTDPLAIEGEISEFLELLENRTEPEASRVRSALQSVRETYALDLKASDLNSMGWPLAIAAAAFLADEGAGIIQADGSGWMLPHGREVSWVLNE